MKNRNKIHDLTGQKFGRLTAIEVDEGHPGKRTFWVCQCDCGNIKSVRSDSLQSGGIKSCGCLKRETDAANVSRNHKHKLSKTPLYNVWQGMKGRCYNENDPRFADWGGRGIQVCEEWRHDFMAFHDWALANGYREGLSIDRIDNDGDYRPDNCRWATQKQQSRNRRSNINITIGNSTRTLLEWCEIFGLNYNAVNMRYRRSGDCSLEGLFNSGYSASFNGKRSA